MNLKNIFLSLIIGGLAILPFVTLAEGPVISDVSVTQDKELAKISWLTNTEADGRIDYGSTESYGYYVSSSNPPSRYHEITIGGFKSETVYHFKITSKTWGGGISQSFDQTFKTSKIKNTVAPGVKDVRTAHSGGTYFIVTFLTDETAEVSLEYDTDQEFKKFKRVNGKKGMSHEIIVKGLKQNTIYWYRLRVKDSDKNETVWGEQRVNTYSSESEKEDLIISRISPAGWTDPLIRENDITLKWHTSRPSLGSVTYHAIKKGSKKIDEKGFYTLDHELILSSLLPGTAYLIKINQRDILGKTAATQEFTLITKSLLVPPSPPAPKPQPKPKNNCNKSNLYGGICLDKDLEKQKSKELSYHMGIEFRGHAPLLSVKNWNVLVQAYTYGGYPVKAIARAIKHGGKTVHPSITWSAWQNSDDYKNYINR
ncbi:MAG: hypothetical protein AAB657_01040 [Patescibacteria group bacterium]